MQLHTVPQRKNNNKSKKRLGRGYGSGKGGHTATRGMKGQKSRTGHKSMVMFEGGNVPFYRRMPKYPGFKPLNKVVKQPINVSVLEENFDSGAEITLETLRSKGLVRKGTKAAKILGLGDLTKKFTIKGLSVSASARAKIEKAKGKIEE